MEIGGLLLNGSNGGSAKPAEVQESVASRKAASVIGIEHTVAGRWFIVAAVLLQLAFAVVAPAGQQQAAEQLPGVSDSQNVPPETCGRCHRDHYATWVGSTHAKINGLLYKSADMAGCEACHGPGKQHAESGSKGFINPIAERTPTEIEQVCLKCHERGLRLYWRGSPHESRNITCTTCHTIHKKPAGAGSLEHLAKFRERPLETRLLVKEASVEVCLRCHRQRRAQLLRSSHMPFREGQITCVDCHNPHGTATPALLRENSANENCYRCHAEKRGPFLWEHPPAVEDCLSCHEAHGSMHRALLKQTAPRLCQRCHARSGHQTQPRLARDRLIFNLGCTNCHSQIHGSNHPSGARFQR